jgi:hypothetical protein
MGRNGFIPARTSRRMADSTTAETVAAKWISRVFSGDY